MALFLRQFSPRRATVSYIRDDGKDFRQRVISSIGDRYNRPKAYQRRIVSPVEIPAKQKPEKHETKP